MACAVALENSPHTLGEAFSARIARANLHDRTNHVAHEVAWYELVYHFDGIVIDAIFDSVKLI